MGAGSIIIWVQDPRPAKPGHARQGPLQSSGRAAPGSPGRAATDGRAASAADPAAKIKRFDTSGCIKLFVKLLYIHEIIIHPGSMDP